MSTAPPLEPPRASSSEAPPGEASPHSPPAPPPRALVGVLLLLLILALVAGAVRVTLLKGIADHDELWHLATGRWIVEHGHLPERDPFTYTAGDTPWVNTNWLAQVVLFALYRRGGIELDWLLGSALLLGTVALVHVRVRARVRSAWAAAPFVFMTLPVLSTGSTIRPQGWTFLLLALALLLVDRVRERARLAPAAALAAALALSGQLHGGFVFVFGAVGIAAVAEAWDGARGEARGARRVVLLLLGALALGTLGFALHPQGFAALAHPLRYAFDPRVREIFAVAELSPPDLTKGATQWTAFWILFLVTLGLFGGRGWRTADALLVLAFLEVALGSARGLHLLAIVAPAPAAMALESALEVARTRSPARIRGLLEALGRLEPAARPFVRFVPLVLALVLGLAAVVRWPRFAPGVPGDVSSPLFDQTERDVAAAAAFLEERHVPGRLLNEMETGGTLAWCCPARPTFIDGRGDLHALSGAWHDLLEIMNREPGWLSVLDRRHMDVALVRRQPVLRSELERAGWRTVWMSPAGTSPAPTSPVARSPDGKPEDAALVEGVSVLVRPGSDADKALANSRVDQPK